MSTVSRSLNALVTRAQRRFGPPSARRGKKNFYRGKGGWKGVKISSKGQVTLDPYKFMFYQVPDLTDFKLKPYVARNTGLINVERHDEIFFQEAKAKEERIKELKRDGRWLKMLQGQARAEKRKEKERLQQGYLKDGLL